MLDQANYEAIRIEREGGIVVLTLNRPDRLNAVNDTMHSELSTVFTDLQRDPESRVAVITGAGRAFCAGGDITPTRAFTTKTGWTVMQEAERIVQSVLDLEKPLIAAVNGHAIGLGATLATLADVAFMASTARIGDPHVKAALPAGNGSAVIWPLVAGVNRAKYLLMTGEIITAEQALAYGLIHAVVEHHEVLGSALELARRLESGHATAIQSTKGIINRLIKAAAALTLPVGLALEEGAMQRPEYHEAIRALKAASSGG
jgi:enoyl-CoA hydratase/carnithine racemase